MMNLEERERRHRYLDKHIFIGLDNLNDGFDSMSISYFSFEQFVVVMERCRDKGIGIYGIERWLKTEKEFDVVVTFEEYKTYPQDGKWYFDAFSKLNTHHNKFIYSASYYVQGNAF